ncbi:c-type cytochrome [Tunturiibacter gelidoferens]|uniref:Cytochrome c n=1 Tax=Tunturiibacter gelidiferens TaxID=3069689 RepID=A0AAU7YUV7_9BACT
MAKKLTLIALLVGLVVVCIYASVTVRRGFSTRDSPSTVEAFVAQRTRDMAIPAKARRMNNPVSASPEVYADARAHFADHCAQCHANNGGGDTPIGRNLYPKPPDMRLAQTQNMSDGELYYTIQYGIRMSGMPAFGEPVDNDQDTWKLVTFIRHLPKLSEQEETEMQHLNPKTPDEIQEEKDEENFLKGDANSATPATTMHHH